MLYSSQRSNTGHYGQITVIYRSYSNFNGCIHGHICDLCFPISIVTNTILCTDWNIILWYVDVPIYRIKRFSYIWNLKKQWLQRSYDIFFNFVHLRLIHGCLVYYVVSYWSLTIGNKEFWIWVPTGPSYPPESTTQFG